MNRRFLNTLTCALCILSLVFGHLGEASEHLCLCDVNEETCCEVERGNASALVELNDAGRFIDTSDSDRLCECSFDIAHARPVPDIVLTSSNQSINAQPHPKDAYSQIKFRILVRYQSFRFNDTQSYFQNTTLQTCVATTCLLI